MTTIDKIVAFFASVAFVTLVFLAFSDTAHAAAYPYGVGGTGTTSPNIGQLVWWGTANQKGVATTSATCAGTASCSAFTVIGGSPITITGGGLTVNAVGTSSAETSGRVPFWTTTGATPALLSGGVAGFAWNNTNTNLTFTYGSTTALSASGNIYAGATSSAAAFSAVSSNSNQFIFGDQGLFVSTLAGMKSIALNATNLTVSGTDVLFGSGFTWTNNTNLLTVTYASTTALTVSGQIGIPAAANPTIGTPTSGFGIVAVDTTAASSSIHWKESTGNEFAVFASTSVAFNYSTSTPIGSTTLVVAGPTRKLSYSSIGCTSVGGTANIQLGNGTASTTMVTSGTSLTTAFTNLTSNTSFGQGQSRLFAIGTFSSTAVTQVTCSLMQGYDPH